MRLIPRDLLNYFCCRQWRSQDSGIGGRGQGTHRHFSGVKILATRKNVVISSSRATHQPHPPRPLFNGFAKIPRPVPPRITTPPPCCPVATPMAADSHFSYSFSIAVFTILDSYDDDDLNRDTLYLCSVLSSCDACC